MSEFLSFDVNPKLAAVENCRTNVRQNADLFVLIVGGRRGSINEETGKSIVNLEYEAAVQEGLDIYVFVDQAVLTLFPIWKQNNAINLNPTVDSNDVFEFVERIRSAERWTFPFSKEEDIFEILAQQLSARFSSLLAKDREGHFRHSDLFRTESAIAQQLVSSMGFGWEHLLTAALMETRVAKCRKIYSDVVNERVLGKHQYLDRTEYIKWSRAKLDELKTIIKKIESVLEEEITVSWGPPGQSGDARAILFACDELNEALRALVEIESDVFRTQGPESAAPLRMAMLGMTEEILNEIEPMPNRLRAAVNDFREGKGQSEPTSLVFRIKFSRGPAISAAIGLV